MYLNFFFSAILSTVNMYLYLVNIHSELCELNNIQRQLDTGFKHSGTSFNDALILIAKIQYKNSNILSESFRLKTQMKSNTPD
jgi:hypothetical protein